MRRECNLRQDCRCALMLRKKGTNAMSSFFRFDGPLVNALNKAGNIILASILWLLGCLPVLTIGASTAALYYCVVKSIRAERGYVAAEFWNAYKHCLKKGIVFTAVYLVLFLLLWLDYQYVGQKATMQNLLLQGVYGLLALFLLEIALYLFPMLSRFALPVKQLGKMALVSVFKYLPYTLGCNLIIFVLVFAAGYLPLLALFCFAGVGCFAVSFLIEPVLLAFMPEPENSEEEQMWYYSLSKKK